MNSRFFIPCELLALVLGLSGCGGTETPCKDSSECPAAQVCLPTNVCAPRCANDSQCLPTERCSSTGGCVAQGACTADGDCGQGQVCTGAGACVTSCLTAGCATGQTCDAAGHCSGDGATGPSCGGELFQASRVEANMLIVLDQSGSMMDQVSGTAKWTAASSAVKSVTATNGQAVRFGLELFPAISSTKCQAGSIAVPVGPDTAPTIASTLPVKAAGSGTPIGASLAAADAAPELVDPTRSNFVLLVTDGKENCNGDPVSVVQDMFTKGIKTFVVGFGSEVDATMLSDMATAGGTARAGAQAYYQADDPASLDAAMASIAAGAIGCDYKLAQAPPDPSKVFVFVNGQQATRDASKANGWDYSVDTNRVTLYGPTCDTVSQDPSAKVSIVYGCPDTSLVEGGQPFTPDAGTGVPPGIN